MDGENNGKPYFLMDDLGGPPQFLETPTSCKKNNKMAIQGTDRTIHVYELLPGHLLTPISNNISLENNMWHGCQQWYATKITAW